jgi:hypothetical protein
MKLIAACVPSARVSDTFDAQIPAKGTQAAINLSALSSGAAHKIPAP